MSSSGVVTIRFIIQNIHYSRLIPIITSHAISSKSKDIRRNCCDFLDYILNNWASHTLEKHVAALQESVKKGIADADPEARVSSRRSVYVSYLLTIYKHMFLELFEALEKIFQIRLRLYCNL